MILGPARPRRPLLALGSLLMLKERLRERHLLQPNQEPVVEALTQVGELAVLQRITTGWSGADVYIVDVEPSTADGPKGLHILKLDARTSAKNERRGHEAAWG